MARSGWDEYFMDIAYLVATRSTCKRRSVGGVAVKGKRIMATGYNGAPSGIKHCDETYCIREDQNIPSGMRHEICWALHSEQNIIIQAASNGIILEGSSIYLTNKPCFICAKMLVNIPFKKVVFDDDYPDELTESCFSKSGYISSEAECGKYRLRFFEKI